LPIVFGEREFYVINVLRRVDPIDHERARLRVLENKWVAGFDEYVFRPDKLVGESLFRIAEKAASIFTVSDEGGEARDFFKRAAALKFGGLRFDLVWTRSE
jgi:hypothetical protein